MALLGQSGQYRSQFPIFKQVGGKSQLLSDLLYACPENPSRYFEPFAGGAALFFGLSRTARLDSTRVVLSDSCGGIVQTFVGVRDQPELVINALKQFEEQYQRGGEALYYRIRDAWNNGCQTPARFIFLRQTSFNGLWRYNKDGMLNMAFGHYAKPKILDREGILAASRALQGVEVRRGDWVEVLGNEEWTPGDLIYCDPPYLGRFNQYDADGFSGDDHATLLNWCGMLARAGVHVVYTNEDVPPVRKLLERYWPEARVSVHGSRRYVNRDGQGRHPIPDLIASTDGPCQESLPL